MQREATFIEGMIEREHGRGLGQAFESKNELSTIGRQAADKKRRERREPNVYRARHEETGEIWYAAATLHDGKYYAPMRERFRRVTGASKWFGPFGYVAFYSSEESARRFARSQDGYSNIADATTNLGSGFEPI